MWSWPSLENGLKSLGLPKDVGLPNKPLQVLAIQVLINHKQVNQSDLFKAWLQLTARSPEMFAPARIPVAAGKKMAKTEKNVWSRKSGPMFSHMTEPERREECLCLKKPNWAGLKGLARCGLTIVTKEAKWLLGFEGNEGSNEVVDDGCDEDNKKEDLSLQRSN